MPTKPRAWPNNAAYARDQAIMEAQEALRELIPVIRGSASPLAVLASIVDHLYKIIGYLKSVA